MGYKIIYTAKTKKTKVTTLLCALILLLSVYVHRNDIRSFLYPAEQALQTLAADLRNGESFRDAVQTFCQDILNEN